MSEEEFNKELLSEKIREIISVLTLLNIETEKQTSEDEEYLSEEFYNTLYLLVGEDPLDMIVNLASFALGLLGGSGKNASEELQRLGLGLA